MFKLVEKHYGEWKRGGKHPAVPVEPPQKREKRAALTWKGATLPMLLEGYHAPAFSTTNVDVPTLDVLSELLFSERAPLYKQLVIKEQKVETLSGSNDAHVDPNLFTVLARIKKPDDLAYVEKAIHDEMAPHRPRRRRREDAGGGAVARQIRVCRSAVDRGQDREHGGVVPGADRRHQLDEHVLRACTTRSPAPTSNASPRKIFTRANRTVVTMKADKP